MSLSVVFSFIVTSLILAAAPGPDNIFVLTQSALYGVRNGLYVILGLCLGICVQTLCMVVGVTAFITAVPILMVLLKLAGVAYLCFLAFMAIKHARAVAHIDLNGADNQSKTLTPYRLVRRGLIMNITNPKVQLFFLSFFPQFLPQGVTGWPLMGYMGLLGFLFTLATLVVFCAVAFFSGTLSAKFKSERFNLCLNYSAAFIFIVLAVYTISSI